MTSPVKRIGSVRRAFAAGCLVAAVGVAQAVDLPWVYENVDRPASTVENGYAVLGSRFVTEWLLDAQASEGGRLVSLPPTGMILFLR